MLSLASRLGLFVVLAALLLTGYAGVQPLDLLGRTAQETRMSNGISIAICVEGQEPHINPNMTTGNEPF